MTSSFRKRAIDPCLAIVPSSSSPVMKAPKLEIDPVELEILLPDGGRVTISVSKDENLLVASLIDRTRQSIPKEARSLFNWHNVFLEDSSGKILSDKELVFDGDDNLSTLFLQDGRPNAVHGLEDMWNVTPVPELLGALPQEYSLETALADLLDNSLQAIWENGPDEERLISLTVNTDKITIFDSGQGMDSSRDNSIAKWGTMGSSSHRGVRVKGVGGKPPYLKPYFGMYGFGGLIAAMHLGGVAAVSSKTKSSKKVVTLMLEKDKLMERCKTDRAWKTRGEYREPTADELQKSSHGSFTKVELTKLKRKLWDENHLKCMLKDIYFPYIQCDLSDTKGRTTTPVRFKVNGTDLAEVQDGEVALTNMHSGNGLPFIIELHLQKQIQKYGDSENEIMEANARIKCLYFPIRQGKESIDNILEGLEEQEGQSVYTFENFPRVSIRRLGRLLPNARWQKIPFMEAKRKKAEKAVVPKICFDRVKAFIDTDAGFVPTASKLDLLNGDAFTTALQNLCSRRNKPDDVDIEIIRDGKAVKILDVEREYEEWIKEMHDLFDEEVNSMNDTDGKILTLTLKELGFSQEVARMFMEIKRKGVLWKSGMRLRFYRGSLPQAKNKDFFATLEYFLADGFLDDKGDTKVICRPMDITNDAGSSVSLKLNTFSLGKSLALSVDFLRPDKCEILDEDQWNRVNENRILQSPGCIDILRAQTLKDFGLDGGLKCQVTAGTKPFTEIYAVVRSKQFVKQQRDGKCLNTIEQKTIMKDPMQMRLNIKRKNSSCTEMETESISEGSDLDISMLVNERSIKGIHGFYTFSIDNANLKQFYTKAGSYALTFSLINGDREVVLEETLEVHVFPSNAIGKWVLLLENLLTCENHASIPSIRLGSEIGPLSVQCFDEYGNLKAIDEPVDLEFEIWCNRRQLPIDLVVAGVSYEENLITIKALKLIRGNLRGCDAAYTASLKLVIADEYVSSLDLNILPGEVSSIEEVKCQDLEDCLKTDDIINIFTLQAIDRYGNPVEKGCKFLLDLQGLELQDGQELERKVDENGYLKLGGLLKVTGYFNSSAEIRVYSEGYKLLYEKTFSLMKRTLNLASMIPAECFTGNVLHDIEVQITDGNGIVDKQMSGLPHLLIFSCKDVESYYPVYNGTCTVSTIKLPDEPGPWSCHIRHINYEGLQLQFDIDVQPRFEGEMELIDFIDHDEATESHTPLLIRDRVCSQNNTANEPEDFSFHLEKIKKETKEWTIKLGRFEAELAGLNKKKSNEATAILQLQELIAKLENQAQILAMSKGVISCGKYNIDENDFAAEDVAEQLSRVTSPASFILKSLASGILPSSDILGTISLIASTKNKQLSKALACFIGQDNMLAIVCKTAQAAELISCRDEPADESLGLERFLRSKSKNKRVHGKLRIYTLEEMRCYGLKVDERHPQKLLKLEEPRTKNGSIPEGFVGFAVNLFILNDEHVNLKTSNGGIRETLLYHLFKNLQVYETSRHLSQAKDAITSGGISLDGTFIHQKRGCKHFGKWEDADVIFPAYSGKQKIPPICPLYESLQRRQVEQKLSHKRQDLKKLMESSSGGLTERIDFVKQNISVCERRLSECKEKWDAMQGKRQKTG